MTLAMDSKLTPTLDVNGQFTMVFGEYEKVTYAIAAVNEGYGAIGDGKIFQTSCAISGVTITITILMADLEQATDANRDWEVATSTELSGKTVTVLVDAI